MSDLPIEDRIDRTLLDYPEWDHCGLLSDAADELRRLRAELELRFLALQEVLSILRLFENDLVLPEHKQPLRDVADWIRATLEVK